MKRLVFKQIDDRINKSILYVLLKATNYPNLRIGDRYTEEEMKVFYKDDVEVIIK